MIDSELLDQAVAAKIAEAVESQVALLFQTDEKLLSHLRSQAVAELVKQVSLSDSIITKVEDEIATQVAQRFVTDNESPDYLVRADRVNAAVTTDISDAVTAEVSKLFTYDKDLLAHLKTQAIAALVRKISVDNNVEKIIADKIAEQFAAEFNGTAIHVESSDRELTAMQGLVVVENNLVARNATIKERVVADELFANTLTVTGAVEPDSLAWAPLSAKIKSEVIQSVIVESKQAMMDSVISEADNLDFTRILLNGSTVLSTNALGKAITQSNLQKLGNLTDISVKGESSLADSTLYANNKRVGINTESPSTALDIWDEEVAISIGKSSAQTGFIGTSRSQDLHIGVNQRGDIKIDNSGTVTVQKFKIGDFTIAFGSTVPSYEGKPGDIVFNTLPKADDPIIGWRCLHNFSWQPIKGML